MCEKECEGNLMDWALSVWFSGRVLGGTAAAATVKIDSNKLFCFLPSKILSRKLFHLRTSKTKSK